MAATRWPAVFADDQWRWELKWDGVRVLLFGDAGEVTLRSRAGRDVTATYPELTGWSPSRALVLDGEVVSLDASGTPSFGRLQGRMNLAAPKLVATAMTAIPISYVVFDVLYDGATFAELTAPRIETPNLHGTGCSLAAAIAANRARGAPLGDAVRAAKQWLWRAIEAGAAWRVGRGRGPVRHDVDAG